MLTELLSPWVQAKLVYNAIAGSAGFYASPVDPAAQSNMNIPFTIPSDPALEKAFIAEATRLGMVRPLLPRLLAGPAGTPAFPVTGTCAA